MVVGPQGPSRVGQRQITRTTRRGNAGGFFAFGGAFRYVKDELVVRDKVSLESSGFATTR
jgi:hypothetical protein